MTIADPRALFTGFYANAAIRSLAPSSRWTISGRIGEDEDDKDATHKAPIDVRALVEMGRVRGAWARDEQCLMTLDELTAAIPAAANNAFYLQAATDGFMAIDVEPACPAEIAANLLDLPEVLYAEVSMSGRGLHLLVPLPETFYDHPVAASKRVLREEHGWYELLLDHWVTFTRMPVGPDAPARTVETASTEFADTAQLYEALAERARPSSASSAALATAEEMPEIPRADKIVAHTLEQAEGRYRDIGDFHDDASRWEFSVLATIYHRLRPWVLQYSLLDGHRYSDSDEAWLLYQAVREVLPPRPKHHQVRNGRPYLLDRAAAMVATKRAERESA